ncbi:MAG: SDR family oxidoreductase [Acidobacteria bacterium]|nr:SDR family oxidoreductase [Acidobacteriota bacterium]
MDELNGKLALVTGASRGIGRAAALALARAGADLVVHYRARAEAAREVDAAVRALGRRSLLVQADVARAAEIERLAREAGPVDILVNNAGIAKPQPVEAITEADWDQVVDTNLKSCFLLTQALLPGMRARRWGRIINLSSVAAQVGGVVGPHYAASKAGMHGLTHFYASHLAREGITVNAIAPALIETEMVTSNIKATPDRIPVGRFGTVDETAEVIVMLARNAYITGQTINVNGGWYLS